MKITIVGAGAMGSLFGGLLAESGNEVLLIDIWQEHVDAINNKGLWIEGLSGDRFIKIKAATKASKTGGSSDLLIVFVKSYHTETAAKNISSLVGENTAILTLQNGLGNFEILSDILGYQKVVAGTTSYGATILGPGRVRHAGVGPTAIGELDGKITPRLKEIAQLFNEAGIKTETTNNVIGLIWSKLLINVGINALGAILQVKNGALIRGEHTLKLQRVLLEEALEVARKKKIELTHQNMIEEVTQICEKTRDNLNSMLQDVLKKRKTEIDFINGAIVREGEKLNLSTPANQIITELIKALEESYDKQI
ncbi:MAG: ketopantoate reductase family protein [Candidatus Caldatribacteriota bacterium]